VTALDYFTKPCEACDKVERGEDPPIGRIKRRFVLNEYDTSEESEKEAVKTYRKRIGQVPTIRMNAVTFEDGERRPVVRWVTGVTPFEDLSEECEDWERKRGARRKTKDPVIQNMDVRGNSHGKKELKWR